MLKQKEVASVYILSSNNLEYVTSRASLQTLSVLEVQCYLWVFDIIVGNSMPSVRIQYCEEHRL